MSVRGAGQPVFPCSAPDGPMEARRFEWFLYFGFTSNRIPHCGPNPNQWLHPPPPMNTFYFESTCTEGARHKAGPELTQR